MTILDQLRLLRGTLDCPKDVFLLVEAVTMATESLFTLMRDTEVGDYTEGTNFNATGDRQTRQDLVFHREILKQVQSTGVCRNLISEESDGLLSIGSGDLTLSLDPFDGSNAYRFGIPAGTIFGVFRGPDAALASGASLVASGFMIYDLRPELFLAVKGLVWRISSGKSEPIKKLGNNERFICANFSNYAKWEAAWQKFMDRHVISPTSEPYNTRWFGSLACHCRAVIISGGAFLYPEDSRASHSSGHIRLIYEAIPLAYIIECLGGACSNGRSRILEIPIQDYHQRTPIAFGEKSLIGELQDIFSET